MKNIVFQINVPNYSKNNPDKMQYGYDQNMYEVSNSYARNYAKKFGADYYILTDATDYKPAAGKHLDYQKLKIYELIDYDAILYLDSDYIIKDNAPNLFEMCKGKFSAVLDQGKAVADKAKELGMPTNRYFNAGMMHIPRFVLEKTKDISNEYLKHEYTLQGQGLLNKLFYDSGIDIFPLDYMDWNPVKRTWGTYADHYSGTKKDRWGQVSY